MDSVDIPRSTFRTTEAMIALSDRSTLVAAQIARNSDEIVRILLLDQWLVLSSTGRVLSGYAGDSEGIAVRLTEGSISR